MAVKRLVLAGAIAASLAGAGLVGVLIGGPSVGYAEGAAEAAGKMSLGRPGEDRGHGHGHGHRHGPPASFEVAADAIGITEEDLIAELEAGESITSVADAEGVDIETVLDALIADATARIQEHVDAGDLDAEEAADRTAELPDLVADFLAHEGLPRHGDC